MRHSTQLGHAFGMHRAIGKKTGSADPKIPAGHKGIANLLGMLEHPKIALNVAFLRSSWLLPPSQVRGNTGSVPGVRTYLRRPFKPKRDVLLLETRALTL